VGGRGSRANGFPLYFDADDYAGSLKRLMDLPIATLAQAHRYRWSKPSTDAVRTGPEARETLEEALGVWQVIDDAVRDALAATPDISFPDLHRSVVRAVAPALDNDPDFEVPAASVSTIAAHRERYTRSA
jgi:hypothetical protein